MNVPLARLSIGLHRVAVNEPIPAASTRPAAHVTMALWAITLTSLAVCLCLVALGVMARLDAQLAEWMQRAWMEGAMREIPRSWRWAAAGISASAISAVLLHTPGHWRRCLFWLASMVISLAWAPVLALAAYRPEVAILFVAVLASGAGSVLYAARHQMPCDESH